MANGYVLPEGRITPNTIFVGGIDMKFLEGQVAFSHVRLSINRSVMHLYVRYCTRATLNGSTGVGKPLNPIRDGDRGFQLFPTNEKFPVRADHTLTLITSLPFIKPPMVG
ncbi:DAZL protein, partial [Polypterus senegalus]|nr:DAZL protein [Polypterus senegalus]